jgi:hypothetical protein
MKKTIRELVLVSALAITPLASANPWDPGLCYISCYNGTTAGPYLSTAESCCADLQQVCGGDGTAYTVYFRGTPFETRLYCLSSY